MLRITIIFGALTVALWFADWIDTPDSIPAIKPLFWACAVTFTALLLRAATDLVRKTPAGDSRDPGG